MKMNFKIWMKEVNRLCVEAVGLDANSFEDYHWRDSFEDGLRPGEALYYFFEDNGYVGRYPEIFNKFIESSEICY